VRVMKKEQEMGKAIDLIRSLGTRVPHTEHETWTVQVNPDTARRLLLLQVEMQRSVSRAHVQRLARTMSDGDWMPCVAPMWIDINNGLIGDGGHRLAAVVKSGTTQKFDFKVAEPEVFVHAIDIARKRGVADGVRFLTGRAMPESVASGIQHRHFELEPSAWLAATHAQRVAVVSQCAYASQLLGLWHARKLKIGAGVLAAALMAYEVSAPDAEKFFASLVANNHLVDGAHSTQVAVLATWIAAQGVDRNGRGGHARIREECIRTLHAWNAWRRRQPMKLTRYSPDMVLPKAI
jgi:hypothetical protein